MARVSFRNLPRNIALLLSTALLAVGLVVVSPSTEAEAAVAVIPAKFYPLHPRAKVAGLSWRARQYLPKIKRWTTTIIGNQMDQPQGLTEVQVVSAYYIRRVFKRSLGRAAYRSAIRIAWRESRLLPNVINDKNRNKTNDWGLFQLNDGGTLQYTGNHRGRRILNPFRNARAARYLVKQVGWGPWGGMLCKESIPCGGS